MGLTMNPRFLSRRSFFACASAALLAQTPSPYTPKQSDRPEAIAGDEAGFVSIFDGKTLAGWQGDPTYWRAADGVMVGEIRPETIVRSNTFLIWQGGEPGGEAGAEVEDFELKVDYRISAAGNSGINYRSVVVEDKVNPANRFAMRGYQCDIDGKNAYSGNNYEEKGRLFLAQRGEFTHVTDLRKPVVLSRLGDNASLKQALGEDWNAVHIIARGNVLVHQINGQLMSMVLDDGPQRQRKGRIGVQVHVGPPMQVEYRNWRLKRIVGR